MPRKTDISFCMIVRDGAKLLPSCLGSVSALVDEMVVIDTGSSDDTIDVARALGATVLRVPWSDDFAAARNAYITAARCSWILSLDADEELGAVEPLQLHALLARHPRTAFFFTIRNYFFIDAARSDIPPAEYGGEVLPGIGYTRSRTIRLFPRLPGVEYSYPVHESLLPALRRARIPQRSCALPIHHMGYLYGHEQAAAKAAMYRELGFKKLAANPTYFLAFLEVGKIVLRDGALDEADRLFRECLRLNPLCSRAYYYLAVSRLRRQQPERALAHLKRALAITPDHGDALHLRRMLEDGLAQRS